MGFYSCLLKNASTRLQFGHEDLTSSDLARQVERTCKEFAERGVRRGHLIATFQANCPWHIVLFLVCEQMELTFAPLYEGLTDFEKSRLLRDLNPHWFAKFRDSGLDLESCAPEAKSLKSAGVLFRTSGTTGNPGFVLQTFGSLVRNAEVAADGQGIDDCSQVLTSLPLSHVGGFSMQTTAALLRGGRIRLLAGQTVESYIQGLRTASHAILVPSFLKLLENHSSFSSTSFHHGPTVITGSTRVAIDTYHKLQERGFRVQSVYGLTEMGPYACVLSGRVSDQDPSFSPLGTPARGYDIGLAEDGEILIKGPCEGLQFAPDTRSLLKVTDEKGQLATGDLGELRNGAIYYLGRKKQVIVVGGLKVPAAEIESQALLFPGVLKCLVLPDEHYLLGEVPIAYVVGEFDKLQLRKFLSQRLARHCMPRRIHLVSEIPQTSIGKNDLLASAKTLRTDDLR